MSDTVRLLEFVKQTGPFEVDVENAIIKHIRILGLESENNRSYLREGVAKAIAGGLYEGKGTNIDHPARAGEATTVIRRNGWLEQVYQHADGGGNGNWHLLKSHPMTPLILEIAQRRPSLLGLSHNASGKTRRENGREIVESIEAVHSVDLVADPATVAGLHEGAVMGGKKTVRELIESCKCGRPGYSRGLREMTEAGLMSADTELTPPPEAAPESESKDHEQAILDACKACLDDSALDAPAKLMKIKKLLGIIDDKAGKSEDAPAAAAAEESRKAMTGLLLENKALKLLSARGLKLTPLAERALKSCVNDADVEATVKLLEESASAGRGQQPRSAVGMPPPASASDGKAPTDPKEFAKYARSGA